MPIANDTGPDTGVYYDPYDVGITANPYPTYARLRDEAPIYYNERYDFWALSRHSDVEKALSNWETFSNCRSDILELMQSDFDMPKGVMMFEDPPIHTMLRGLMSRVFTPRRMAEIEDQIRRFCVNCLDPLVGSDGFDIIAELASMMPMRVIGMLLGIPESAQVSVRDANDANLRTKPGTPMKVVNADAIADGRIYADYVEWRSKNPSDDLMTALLNVEFDDEHGVTRKLTRKEVLHYTQVVAGAGNETTGRLIGWLAKVLAEHPDQRRQVAEDRALLLRVVDETLRFEPTGPHVARYLARDFEIYDTTVPAGSAMLLLFGAANRDPRRYADPDTFDIHRDNISHLTFGKGLHYCLGANLARLEGRVALDELLNRWPEWGIDYDGAQLAPTSTVRGWERLRIIVS
jgi:cytochrome P450